MCSEKKICNKCSVEKEITDFRHGTVKGKVYVRHTCKKCDLKIKELWNEQNPEKVKEYKHKQYKKNQTKYDKLSAEWIKNNPDRRREIANKYAKENKPRLAKYRSKNKERINKYNQDRVDLITDSYVLSQIKQKFKLSKEQRKEIKNNSDLIETYRDKLKIVRTLKKFDNKLKSK